MSWIYKDSDFVIHIFQGYVQQNIIPEELFSLKNWEYIKNVEEIDLLQGRVT